MFSSLIDAVVNFDVEGVRRLAQEVVDKGIDPYEAITEALNEGMRIVGEKYEAKEYFLSELLLAGESMKAALEVLTPHLKAGGVKAIGKVVIGTVKGDIHDIGKTIVVTLLRSAGFEVVDLGVDVSAERFLEGVREADANILAMSALLTTTMPYMGEVIKKLEEEGLRDKVTVIVGGAPLSEEYAKRIGADLYAADAVEAARKLRDHMERSF
ncbi:corrinoid protein [Candidatus Bathyarchaeota archaeon]|nr:corrinoid protein [Candidatus Bathyarchaeota archaeon]